MQPETPVHMTFGTPEGGRSTACGIQKVDQSTTLRYTTWALSPDWAVVTCRRCLRSKK